MLGFDVDYKRLLAEFESRGTIVRAFYCTQLVEDQEYSSIRPLVDWLRYNGYTVVTKPAKEFVVDPDGRRRVKGDMHIELAVNAMELANHIDEMVLFSGDGDFRYLVQAVQRRGVRVAVALGSIEYSAVTQPRPVFRIHDGTASSTDAAQSTLVCPTSISAEPSAVRR
jgi:uncharacterized LabA/DUF88 family protein